MLFGFNHSDAGFSLLLSLFVLVPLLDLSWLIIEIILSIKQSKQRTGVSRVLMPGIALLFFVESIAADLYLLSQMRM